jgi:hypothetical protein
MKERMAEAKQLQETSVDERTVSGRRLTHSPSDEVGAQKTMLSADRTEGGARSSVAEGTDPGALPFFR